MTASLVAVEPGGRIVRLWQPAAVGPVVVLLGRSATEWAGSSETQPNTLAAAGYWPIAVGANTVADIEAAITYAGGRGADTTRVVVLGHGTGCQGALDWGIANHERVTAMALVAPTGVSLSTPKTYIARDVLGAGAQDTGRLSIWHTAADTTAAQLATDLAAADRTLTDVDTTAVADLLVSTGNGWKGRDAHREMAKWRDLMLSNPQQEWHGADFLCETRLADGRTLTSFADTIIGTVDADLTFNSVFNVRHSSMVIREADGTLAGNELFNSGTSGAAWPDPADTSSWFWTMRGVVESTHVRFLGFTAKNHTGGNPAILFDTPHTVILSRRLSDLAVDGVQYRPELATLVRRILWGYSIIETPDRLYIYGSREGLHGDPLRRTYLARCPTGVITGPWEFWSTSGWRVDVNDAEPLEDTSGVPVLGETASVVRPTGRQFHMATTMQSVTSWTTPVVGDNHGIDIYRSPYPWGPWELRRRIVPREDGAQRYGATYWIYQAQWMPHVPSPAGTMALAWHANKLGGSVPIGDQDYAQFRFRVASVDLD